MRVIKDEALITRNGRIGQWTSLGALGVLAIGMYLSFYRPELWTYSIGALLVGFLMTQIGMYYSSRFGRSPRPDEKLDAGLKGLPGDVTLYHYKTPVSHLLVGPMGIWVLLPYHQRGTVSYEGGRWRVRGGGFMQAYMTLFGQEGLGRPDREAERQVKIVGSYLAKRADDFEPPEARAVLVFTHDGMEVDVTEAPLPAVHLKKLKDFFRQRMRERPATSLALQQVKTSLPQE